MENETKKKILIVDDEIDIVETLKFILEDAGYQCYCAFDGEEGLNLAREIMPDLMILDVMMPKINGYKISRLLKYDNKYKNIPIMMVTARSQDEDKLIGEETGVNEYITKPFEIDYVVKKVNEYLKAIN
ncbi:MAG: response regulator [Candidatus Gastranaerophilales bacterium]|nr:response regulator [Candidatus Gastranaerophilales bacterium]